MSEKRKLLLFGIPAIALLVLAIVQILLIFGSPMTGRGEASETPLVEASSEGLLRPTAMYVTLGGQEKGCYARINPEEEAFDAIFFSSVDLIKKMVLNNWFLEEQKENLPFDQPAVIYTYPIPLSMEYLREELAITFGQTTQYSFSQLWILPSLSEMDPAKVYLVDPNGSTVMNLSAGTRSMEENLVLYQHLLMEGTTREKDYLEASYVFEKEALFGGFVPQTSSKETILTGKIGSYFASNFLSWEASESRMRNYALSFFEYPDTVSVHKTEDGYIYLNEKISLRISRNGLANYVETLTDREKQVVSLREAFRIAEEFLRADLNRQVGDTPEVVFAGFERGDGEYTFYFDYMLGGRLLIVDYPREGMEHAVTIVVRGAKVQRSERILKEVYLREETKELRTTWLDVANRSKSEPYEAIPYLAYYEVENTLIPRWIVVTKAGMENRSAY